MFDAFFILIYGQLFSFGNSDAFDEITLNSTMFGDMGFDYYISVLLALICTITVFVCVCLMVLKIIKLFSRLWSRF